MSLKNKGIFLLLFQCTSIISIKEESMIVFPFNIISVPFLIDNNNVKNNYNQNNKSINNKYNSTTFFDENYIFRLISPIKIGDPPQEIISLINIYDDKLLIGELPDITDKIFDNSFPKGYQYKKSSSFINLTSENKLISNESDEFIGEEKIYLFSKISDIQNNKLSCINLQFKIDKKIEYNNNLLYGVKIGLILSDNYNESNFMRQIHEKSIISKYLVSFEYINNNNGMLIIGKYPHEYLPEKYSEENLKSFYSYQPRTMYLTNFVISFDEIYSLIDNEKFTLKQKPRTHLILNSGFIIGTKEYMEFIENNFFNNYINICEKDKIKKDSINIFIIYYCIDNAKLKLEKFPTLNFKMKSENLTFVFTYKDLFKKIENKYYFLIVFEKFNSYVWRLGKPLFFKYSFVYNGDSKTIGFYLNKNSIKTEKNNIINWNLELNIVKIFIIVILFLFFVFLVILISYYFGKKYNFIRKKHAMN